MPSGDDPEEFLSMDRSSESRRSRYITYLIERAGTDEQLLSFEMLRLARDSLSNFRKNLLYPSFATMVDYLNTLDGFGRKVETALAQDKTLEGIDFEEGTLVYRMRENDIPEIGALLEAWSICRPRFVDTIEEGKGVYEAIDESIDIRLLSLLPGSSVRLNHGFLALSATGRVDFYAYGVDAVERLGADPLHGGTQSRTYRMMRSNLVHSHTIESEYTSEQEARRVAHALLSASDTHFVAFLCDAQGFCDFPLDETLKPIAKRKLLGVIKSYQQDLA